MQGITLAFRGLMSHFVRIRSVASLIFKHHFNRGEFIYQQETQIWQQQ